MQVAKTVDIRTKNGSLLTVDLSDVLVERIKDAFGFSDSSQIESRHVEAYLVTSMKNALKADEDATSH